jgi:Ca2+-transporting ATPase
MKIMEQPYALSSSDVVKQLESNSTTGLAQQEADKRLAQYGLNQLERYKPPGWFSILLAQIISPLVWILALAAGLAFIFQEWLEGIAVVVVIFINAGIGFFMEKQAVQSMEALRKLSQTFARVIRDKELKQIPASELVPGDIIQLEAGDMVPADSRLIKESNLGISEAALTGESTQVSKKTDQLPEDVILAEQKNLVFKGTMVTRGNAKAIVTGTGKNTQLGKIALLAQEAHKEITPLEKKLNILSQKLIWLTLVLTVLILLLGIFQGRDLFLMIETAIALAIAAIPEGLPIVATIALAKGMLRLAKYKVIVKKLSAVETLGETEVIFTDKTGTLTENQLMPDTLVFEFGKGDIQFRQDKIVFTDPEDTFLKKTFAFEQMQKVAALCNNASLKKNGEQIGDPIEIALLKLVEGNSIKLSNLQQTYPRIREIPFDSDTKMMGTLHKNGKRPDYLVCLKGALEVVLAESDYLLTRDGKIPLTDRKSWLQKADQLAARGLRILGFAYSEIDEPKEDFSHHLIFIGFIGFIDPPREEVKDAIQTCRQAGIRVVMVTGDHPETARNIAFKTGLSDREQSPVIHGKVLQNEADLSDTERDHLYRTNIFARVNPAQKLNLVTLYQTRGKTVGMTGDGVNDTPALKKADIGIAMGQRGTEAAKEAADLVLEDDAFTSIVVAIKQGRGIFENIRYFVIYLLSCNLSELLVVAVAFFSNLTMPLLPLQILFINMVTDVFPALALGMNKEAENVMEQSPRSKNEPIISRLMWTAIVVYAVGITIASLGALLFATYYLKVDEGLANNFAFYTLILAQLWHVFNLPEANRSFFNNEVTKNKFIWMAIVGSIGIMVIAYALPVLNEVLRLETFSVEYLGYVVGFSLLPVILIQLLKWIRVIR